MRGTPRLYANSEENVGIIPAHAGNTVLANVDAFRDRDHPRACGEHFPLNLIKIILPGSSPRMRGTRWLTGLYRSNSRIIPAHAGNTGQGLRGTAGCGDHPRACGEHSVARGYCSTALGSSPRMRGTHFEISTIPRFLDSFCLFFIQFHFEYFFACRYLLALLHPRRRAPPKDTSFALDGRLTSSNPSQSVGDQSAPCTLNARCCSFLAE